MLGTEQFGQQGALRAEHGLHAERDAHHHDRPDEGDVAEGDQIERRQGDDRLEERTVAVDGDTAEPVGQGTEGDHHDRSEAGGDQQPGGADELVAREDTGGRLMNDTISAE